MESTLDKLPRGAWATVSSFAESDQDAVRKLLSLGLAPGDRLRVLSCWPAVVFEVGASCLAMDSELAGKVRVVAGDV